MDKIKKNKFKPVYKKFIRLKVNPLNNNKLLKLIKEPAEYKIKKTKKNKIIKIRVKKAQDIIINRFKKQKWSMFFNIVKKKFGFFRKYKPYTFFHYNTSKRKSSLLVRRAKKEKVVICTLKSMLSLPLRASPRVF